MLHPEHTGSVAAGFPTKKPQLEQSQARPGSGPLEIICSLAATLFPSTIGSYLCHAFSGGETRHATRVFLGAGRAGEGDSTPMCEHAFVGNVEWEAADAEVARRSRVMAGLDDDDEGALLEASIVEAMQRLRRRDRSDGETGQTDGDET